jgi:hypothetical protein
MRTPRWLAVAFVLSLALVNPYVRGDGNGYYAWLVSPIVDGDLDFENQYRRADPFFQPLVFEADGRPRAAMQTPAGQLRNQWSVGPAVLWLPWFLTAHAGVQIARVWWPDLPADGYSWPYRYACAIGTACYGWLALLFARRAAHVMGRGEGATVALLAGWTATALPVYQYFLPFHVPALAAFAVSWFVWRWLARRESDAPARWAEWGALAGLATLVYQLNAVLLLLPAYELLRTARRDAAQAVRGALVFAACFAVACLPHFVGKGLVYGTPWTTGYEDRFFWWSPRLWQTALSAEHGWFSWHPAAAAGVIGLALLARRRDDARVLLVACAAFFFAVASYQNWHGQSSFGNRFFVSLTVLLVIGLADLAARAAARARPARLGAAAVLAFLMLWNAGLAYQWGTDIIPNRGPVDFRVVASNQVTIVPTGMFRFLRRYFSSRDAAARELEQRDLPDSQRYKLKR